MARVSLRNHLGVEVAGRDVTLEPPAASAGWQTPPARANIVIGQTVAFPVSDTFYEDCLFTDSTSSSTSKWNGLQRVTILRPRISLPTIIRGWRDVWFGGAQGQLVNAGPRTDGNDLCQIKRNGTTIPDGVTLAYIDFHDVTRPTSDDHPDGIQLMCGRRVTVGGSRFRTMQNGVQPIFVRDAGSSAGGGPIEDTWIDACEFSGIAHFYSIRVAGNDEEGASGRFVPVRTKLTNLNLGGKNALVDAAAADLGLTYSGITNGEVKLEPR